MDADIGKALDLVDGTTRVKYLLSYYPNDTKLDGSFRKSGIPFSVSIPFSSRGRHLKVVVYEMVGDKLGCKQIRIPEGSSSTF
jgi:hypothetical protein